MRINTEYNAIIEAEMDSDSLASEFTDDELEQMELEAEEAYFQATQEALQMIANGVWS
jgi:hypothetical protein